MYELRNLFAILCASFKSYVDPTKAVEILKGTLDSTHVQQDVSEFTHKLLEWLEDAYAYADKDKYLNHDHHMDTSEVNQKIHASFNNPMVQLFYGTYKVEGQNEGMFNKILYIFLQILYDGFFREGWPE